MNNYDTLVSRLRNINFARLDDVIINWTKGFVDNVRKNNSAILYKQILKSPIIEHPLYRLCSKTERDYIKASGKIMIYNRLFSLTKSLDAVKNYIFPKFNDSVCLLKFTNTRAYDISDKAIDFYKTQEECLSFGVFKVIHEGKITLSCKIREDIDIYEDVEFDYFELEQIDNSVKELKEMMVSERRHTLREQNGK